MESAHSSGPARATETPLPSRLGRRLRKAGMSRYQISETKLFLAGILAMAFVVLVGGLSYLVNSKSPAQPPTTALSAP